LAQWACHAGNLAAEVGDEALFGEACALLFPAPEIELAVDVMLRTVFVAEEPAYQLFGFSMLTRAALTDGFSLAPKIRNLLNQPGRWDRLVDNVSKVTPQHPLELYARHLYRLAPETHADEAERVLQQALSGFGNTKPNRIADLLGAGTLAWAALRDLEQGQEQRAEARREKLLSRFKRVFEDNEWVSCTTYHAESESGWFYDAVEQLERELSRESLSAFIERFRFEFR
jgi:hypothetical protein